jgi:hypothetical protein
MESLILSSQALKNLDEIDVELRTRTKTLMYLDLSGNYLT